VPALIRLLGDADSGSRAARVLVQVGEEAFPALLGALSGEDPRVRVRAVAALAGMRRPGALAFSLAAIDEHGPVPRKEDAFIEREVPATVHRAVLGALEDPHPRVREASVRALSEAGLVTPGRVHLLVELLEDDDRRVRGITALALGRARSRPREVVPALGRLLDDGDPVVRERALEALSFHGRWAAPLAPEVVAALDDPELRVRSMATRAVEHLGPAAAAAVPKLASLLGDEWLGHGAAGALAAIGPEALSALEEALASTDPAVRENAVSALARMGPLAAPARGTLAETEPPRDPLARLFRERLIEELASWDGADVNGLLDALVGGSRKRRHGAATALGQLGRAAVPGLASLLGDAPEDACGIALLVLAEIGPAAEPALPAIRGLLTHESEAVRAAAARAASAVAGE